MKTLKKILLVIVVIFLLLQLPFFGPKKNFTDAKPVNDISTAYQIPNDIQMSLNKACYDCHSNYTKDYPWYAYIQPISWWMNKHIVEAKKELNFSEFTTYSAKRKARKFEEIAEVMEDKSMPLKSYLIMHKEAELSAQATTDLITWAKQMHEQAKQSLDSTTQKK